MVGKEIGGGRRKGYRAALALLTVTWILSTHAAFAQSSRPSPNSPRTFSIPAGSLANALVAFGRQAGVQISYVPAVAAGLTTKGVSGSLIPDAALSQLLSGSGLSYRFTGAQTVLIERPGSAAIVPPGGTLEVIDVQGKQESAWGPVDGFVATRSATGTKTDTPIIETPQSISVVPRDQIEAQNADSAKQALRYTAGVAGENRGNFGGYDIMYGRGFILDQYWDGMRLPGAAGVFPPQPEMFGIERVEFLRGPSSVLFGQGSLGGLVNLVGKRPSAVASNEVVVQGGSYGRIQGGFDSTGPLDKNGDFLYRITGFAKDADNQVNYVKEQRYYISPALTWRPTKDTNWTVKFDYQNDPAVGYYNFVPMQGSLVSNPAGVRIPTSFYSGDPNFNTMSRKTYAVSSFFDHQFSDVFKVRQNTRFIDTTGTMKQVLPLGLESNLLGGSSDTLYRYAQGVRERVTSLTTDTQGEFKFGTGPIDHKVLVGVDTQNVLFKQAFAQSAQDDPSNTFCTYYGLCSPQSAPPISLSSPVYGYQILNPLDDPTSFTNQSIRQTLQQVGFYAQDQIKIGRLSIVGGVRYDSAQVRTDTLDFVYPSNSGATKQNDHATTGRVGVVYEFESGVAPFATYATSFNPTLGRTTGVPLKPTTGELHEAGVKFQSPGSKIFAQFSVFELTQQNYTTQDPLSTDLRQIGEVRSRGFEIEGRAQITDNFVVLASYTNVDPVITKSTGADLGMIPTWVPRQIGAVWGDYTIREGALNGLGFSLGVRHMGQTFGDAQNTLVVPSYTLADAGIHYDLESLDPRFKGARLSVNATNLFDKIYVSQCTVQFDNNCVYGLRRQVLATLRYKW